MIFVQQIKNCRRYKNKLGKIPRDNKRSENPSIKINGARRGLFILNFFILLSQDSVLFFSALRPYQQF